MLQQDKDKLEERIVAYFEGALDKDASKSLLADVAKSTESRALFKAHESLNALISAARVPMEAPLEAKRSIAERIPGLLAFIPGLLGGAQALPILTQSANPFIAFFTKMSLSTAISVGTSVAVLTTAGVVIKNKLEDNAAHERAAHVTQIQQQAKVTDQQYQMVSPSKDIVAPELGNSAAAGVAEGNEVAPAAPHSASTSSVAPAKLTASISTTATHHHTTLSSHDGSNAVSNNGKVAGTSATATPVAKAIPAQIQYTTNTPPAATEDGSPLTTVAPLPSAIPSAGIPTARPSLLGAMPDGSSGAIVHPFARGGSRMILLQPVDNNAISRHQSEAGATPVTDLSVGMDVELAPALALRFQLGNTQYAQMRRLEPEVSAEQGISLQKYTYFSRVELSPATWYTTGGLAYNFEFIPGFNITTDGNLGVAWMSQGPSLMTSLGLSTQIDISSRFAIEPGVTFDATWVKEAYSQVVDNPSGNAILVHREIVGTGTLLNNAFGLHIGFMFKY